MNQNMVCFAKKTYKEYENFIDSMKWILPDLKHDFGMVCMLTGVLITIGVWVFVMIPLHGMNIYDHVGIVLGSGCILTLIIPSVLYPVYKSFGICFCGCESRE